MVGGAESLVARFNAGAAPETGKAIVEKRHSPEDSCRWTPLNGVGIWWPLEVLTVVVEVPSPEEEQLSAEQSLALVAVSGQALTECQTRYIKRP